eukprot:6419002-Lingulodinium_polyedra.AAC.1
MYETIAAASTVEALRQNFRKECNRRHSRRADVKKGDAARLRTEKFADLLIAIEKKYPQLSTH